MALLPAQFGVPQFLPSTSGRILWPRGPDLPEAACQFSGHAIESNLVLLTDGRGGVFLTSMVQPSRQQQQLLPEQQLLPGGSCAQPASYNVESSGAAQSDQTQDKRLQGLLAAIDVADRHDHKRGYISITTLPACKRQRLSTPCSSTCHSDDGIQFGAQQPSAVKFAFAEPPARSGLSDDESGCSSRTLHPTNGSHPSLLFLQQQQQIAVEGSATSKAPVSGPVLIQLLHTRDGTVVLPSDRALVQSALHTAPPQTTSQFQQLHGSPLATPLQVPAGMLLPTPVGYELRPARTASEDVQAALADPSCSLQELATSPLTKVVPSPWTNSDRSAVESALAEILEVCRHKPRGRPVKYIDLGINRMALKYHVGIKINGRVESMGATDSELAAMLLLDMVKIGLGLYVDAAVCAPAASTVHPKKQMTATLNQSPWLYTTMYVQRVVAQLINRNLVPASELLHAYTRAHTAGCRPAPCLMSVAAALTAGPGKA